MVTVKKPSAKGYKHISSRTLLEPIDVLPHWFYIGTAKYNSDSGYVYEMWQISGGAAAYCINEDQWYMLHLDKETDKIVWISLGYGYKTTPEEIDKASKQLTYGCWLCFDGEWYPTIGKMDDLDFVEQTKAKVKH